MKLASFSDRQGRRLGVVDGDQIIDLAVAAPQLPVDMTAFLAAGPEALAAAAQAKSSATGRIGLDKVRLEAPLPNPRKFLGLGLSFKTHVEEIRKSGMPIPLTPNQVWFNKQVTCIVGPTDPIHLPRVSSQLDYEGEMAMVIGTRCRHVKAADAHKVIAGFMVCNDVSVRDWQMRAPTAQLGKSFDTHGPTGPWLTTPDEAGDPGNLRIRTWVDDDLRQDGNTNDFVYTLGQMIEELTTVFTLEPGDILATGTPSGIGAMMKPPNFLKAGQRVKVEIENLGAINNLVIAEPV
ncbi:MAG: fumarylacetoacetate hydrolase family protein [Rhodospirillaceae bacterium]|nr:fumarylacetoacetate hydrolase family protein [Rhodospirillaceae bacterium]